jgi:hypothetical protein
MFKLDHDHDPRSHENGEEERKSQLRWVTWLFKGSSPIEDQKKKIDLGSGYVTKWYQSMVTTLGLIELMHKSRIILVRNTPMRSNPLT